MSKKSTNFLGYMLSSLFGLFFFLVYQTFAPEVIVYDGPNYLVGALVWIVVSAIVYTAVQEIRT